MKTTNETRNEKIELISHYGNLKPIKIMWNPKTHEVSYRQARRAARNCAGDYYAGLQIDPYAKRAWVEIAE